MAEETPVVIPPADETAEAKAARLEADNAKLVSEKDMLHGRATKAEGEVERLKKAPPTPPAPAAPAAGSGSPSIEDVERRIEEKADLRAEGYSREEIAEAEVYAKAKGLSLSDALKQPFVKAAIDGLRAEKRGKEATPSSTSRGAHPQKVEEVAKLKPHERKEQLSPEAWREKRRRERR